MQRIVASGQVALNETAGKGGRDGTPLYAATRSTKPSPQIVKLLLSKGADPSYEHPARYTKHIKLTPMREAADRLQLSTTRLLRQYGAQSDGFDLRHALMVKDPAWAAQLLSKINAEQPKLTFTPRTTPTNAQQNVERFDPIQAKYVRLTVQRANGEPIIDELEIYSGTRNVALASAIKSA